MECYFYYNIFSANSAKIFFQNSCFIGYLGTVAAEKYQSKHLPVQGQQ